MARFRKEIVSSGRFYTGNGTGGRQETELTPDRLAKWVKTFKALRNKGYNIPAPWGHDLLHGVPVRFGRDGVPDPLKNAGFVEDLSIEMRPTEDGGVKAVLIGEFDVPGDENDPNSPAGKVGKQVKETSVYVRPKFIDGTGEVHDEALMHAALVLHGIEPGQKNFEHITDPKGGYAIAMSQMVMSQPGALADQMERDQDDEDELREEGGIPTSGGGQTATGDANNLGELIKEMRNAKLADLPDSTTLDTLVNYLLVAVRQKKFTAATPFVPANPSGSLAAPAPGGGPPQTPPGVGEVPAEQSGIQSPQSAPNGDIPPGQPSGSQPPPGQPSATKQVDLRKPPKAGVEQPPSIAMSQEQQIIQMSQQINALTKANELLVKHVNGREAESRVSRINNLVATGRVTREYADKSLVPMLAGFQMSLGADGNPAKHPADMVLEALEGQPARVGSTLNSLGASPVPGVDFSNLPEAVRNQAAAVLMSAAGAGLPGGAVEQDIGNFFVPHQNIGQMTDAQAKDAANAFAELCG